MFLKRAVGLAGLASIWCFMTSSCSSAVEREESRAAGSVGTGSRLELVISTEENSGQNTISFELIRPEAGAGDENVLGRIRALVGDGVLAIKDSYRARSNRAICPKH